MILPRSFYHESPVIVAPKLIGTYLVRRLPDGTTLSGMIIEVEAYLGAADPASHSYKGRNDRNKSLFLPCGHAYVHTQRHHTLLDVTVDTSLKPNSVLIRSLIPEEGIEEMAIRRKKESLRDLTNGPGKICQAFAITKADDGIDLVSNHTGLWIEDRGVRIPAAKIIQTPRIGLSREKEALLRYVFTPERAF